MKNSTFALSKSIAALLASLAGSGIAAAAVLTWDGGAATNELTTNLNWNPDAVPSPAVPDTMQWNGSVAGPLALVISTSAFGGASGNTGLNLDVTAGQTAPLSIDAAAGAGSIRMNGLTVAAGAGPVSLGDGTGTALGLTLGGAGGATHTWTNNSSNAVTLGSEVTIGLGGGGTHTLSLNGAGGYVFNNPIGGGALTMTVRNNAIATFNATSSYTGNTNVGTAAETGIVRVNANNALGTGTITFGNNASTARLELLGGRVLSNAITFAARSSNTVAIQSVTGANTLSGALTLGTGGGIYRMQVDAGSSLTLSNANSISGGAITGTRTVTLGGAGTGFINGAIVNGTAGTVVAITKTDAGVWTLAGTNTYTGTTTVSGGTLITSPAQTGSTTVTVADGATFGVKLAATGTTFSANTVTTGVATGASLLFDTGTLGNPTAAILNAVNFTPAAPTVLRVGGTALAVGNNLPLLDYTGTIGGVGFAGLSLALPARTAGFLVDNPVDSRVDFSITQVEQVKWQGNASGDWDADTDGTGTNGSQNWLTTVNLTPTKYLQGTGGIDVVNFTDSATGSTSINIAVPVTPAATFFNNSVANYTFASAGGFGIGGAGALVKGGTASLTLNTANSYAGGTTLNAGTLNVANASALGTGAVTINGGTLDNTSGGALAVTGSGARSVNGDFTFTGTNELDLGAGAVTVGGVGTDRAITVAASVLSVGEIKAAAHGLTKLGAGTLVVGSVGAAAAGSVISGALTLGAGTVQINRPGAVAGASGDFTAGGLTGSGTLGNGAAVERWLIVDTSGDFNFAGTLANGGAAGLGFSKQGAGAQILSGTNSYTGQTTVGGGTLRIASPLANSVVVVNGGALSLEVANAVSQNSITLSGAGTLAQTVDNAITGTATLVAQKSLTLSRPNSYSGDTTINAGTSTTVTITDPAAAGASRLNGATGATTPVFALHLNGGGLIPMANSVGGNSGVAITVDVDNNGSGSNGVVQLNGNGSIGNSILNVTGNNGYRLVLAALASSAGAAGTTVLNPTTASLTLGTFTSSSAAAKTLQLDGTGTGNAVTDSISNGTAASVALTKSNTSTWTLGGASTYTGATSVNGGELIVTGSLTGTSSVSVAGGATLSGNSLITTTGNITLADGSFLEPGNGESGNVGTLFFSTGGFLDLSAVTGNSGSLKFPPPHAAARDSIALSFGAINVGTGTLGFSDFAFSPLAGFGSGTYTLVDSGSVIVGTLDSLNLNGSIGAFSGTLGYSLDGTDIVLTVVPEPGSALLLVAGTALCAAGRRRRR